MVPRNTVRPGSFEDDTDPGDDPNEHVKMQIPVLEGDDDPLLAPLSIDIIKVRFFTFYIQYINYKFYIL